MVPSAWLPALALLMLALPSVYGQENTCTRGDPAKKNARCIKTRSNSVFASAFCSGILPITTPFVTSITTVTDTSTRGLTTFTGTVTETFSPPATTTISETSSFSSTVTETQYSTVITGTITLFVETRTEQVTSYTNILTCPGDPTSASSASSNSITSSNSSHSSSSKLTFPTTGKNVTSGHGPTGTGPIGTGTGTGPIGTGVSSSSPHSGSLLYYTWKTSSSSSAYGPTPTPYTPPAYIPVPYGGFGKDKRQATPSVTVPRCVFNIAASSGLPGLQDACNCLDIARPTTSIVDRTVTDPSNTITVTSILPTDSTSTITPTVTVTQSINDTQIFTETITRPTSVATTVPGTLTITETSLQTIVGPSPTPSSFNIYYIDNSTNTARFFQSDPAPGGDGVLVTTREQASFFSIDSMKRLVFTAQLDAPGDLFFTKNAEDLYPFTLLRDTAADDDTAVCEGCGGKLTCDWSGTKGNVFARCFNYLALGQPEVFGQDADLDGEGDCEIIELLFK